MNGTAARFVRLGAVVTALVTLGWVLTGQAAKPAKQRISLPTDWSHRHVIFSQPKSAERLARVSEDPRYWQQIYRRQQTLALPTDESDASSIAVPGKSGQKLQGDWSIDLGAGASVGAVNYPAKYSFNYDTVSCSSDYVVYNTGLAGSSTQASIVAFNNLYRGCTATVPSAYWAYQTGGQVLTSPVISKDGTQVAFVETNGGFGILDMLKWAPSSGTVSSPLLLTPVSNGAYSTCTAPCMTQVLLKDGVGAQTNDTTSSVYYDYTNDVAWVGGALGWLHKITGVFKGVPTEETHGTGVFPVQVPNAATWISSPVYDPISNNVFVGDSGGFLYSVNATTGAVTASNQLDFGTGIVDGPVLDIGNGWVYVFSSSDGSAACTGGVACAAVYQLSTTFAANTAGTKVTVGNSVVLSSFPNPNPMYIGGFDSAYYSSSTATGNLYVCGNTGAVPTLYGIPFVAGTPGTSAIISSLATAGSTARCSSVTDIPNPNTTGGPSERLFFSVQNNALPLCASPTGCLISLLDTAWQPTTSYAVGQRVLSKNYHVETAITAGTSGALVPAWTSTAGLLTIDGSVVWIDEGNVRQALSNVWLPSHTYTSTTFHFIDSNGNIEVATTLGTSGTSEPAWNTAAGGTTLDNTVVWTNAGASGVAALAAAGGTSGIIDDNIVAPGTLSTSQVYFTTLADQTCITSTGTGGCAVQASQTALQ